MPDRKTAAITPAARQYATHAATHDMTHQLTENPMHTTTTRAHARPIKALLLLLAGALCALAGLSTTATPASAETTGAGGWIRLAHLSPNTPAVNVALTSVGNSKAVVKVTDVGYGSVSAYQKVPAGRYVASMTPAGGSATSTPVVTQAVTVKDNYAYTVAAVGLNANLRGEVLNDDLRPPSTGNAKIRLLQAATNAPTATITAVDGPVLARNAAFGSATGYAQIKAGVWTVDVTPAGSSAKPIQAKVTAVPGSVNTIVVLDGAKGAVTTKVLRDASSNTMTAPKKGTGVETGFGGTATQFVGGPAAAGSPAASTSTSVLAAGAALLVLAAGLFLRQSRQSRRVALVRQRPGQHNR